MLAEIAVGDVGVADDELLPVNDSMPTYTLFEDYRIHVCNNCIQCILNDYRIYSSTFLLGKHTFFQHICLIKLGVTARGATALQISKERYKRVNLSKSR